MCWVIHTPVAIPTLRSLLLRWSWRRGYRPSHRWSSQWQRYPGQRSVWGCLHIPRPLHPPYSLASDLPYARPAVDKDMSLWRVHSFPFYQSCFLPILFDSLHKPLSPERSQAAHLLIVVDSKAIQFRNSLLKVVEKVPAYPPPARVRRQLPVPFRTAVPVRQ